MPPVAKAPPLNMSLKRRALPMKQQVELASLRELSAMRTNLALAVDVLAILGLLFLASRLSNALALFLVFVLVARQQHALAILVHEGVHRRLYKHRAVNDFVARWLITAPLWLSYDGYRHTHLLHHKSTMSKDDPDLEFVKDFPVDRGRLAFALLMNFTGLSYVMLLVHYWRHGLESLGDRFALARSLLPPLLMNLLIFLSFYFANFAGGYVLFWLLPMFTVLPLLLHLRGICEHGGHIAHPDPLHCTWTVLNPLQAFFVAPHNSNYHIEHHAFPAVPQFNLPKLHRLLQAEGTLPGENVKLSYVDIIKNHIIVQ